MKWTEIQIKGEKKQQICFLIVKGELVVLFLKWMMVSSQMVPALRFPSNTSGRAMRQFYI